jgi:hypothetical protein
MAMSGGCLCGAVRYAVDAEPLTAFVCHCRACQYVSGGTGANVVIVPRTSVRLTRGALRTYWSIADSGAQIGRQFCEICGTPILSDLESQPDLLVIKAGSLDEPAAFKPSANLWTDAAQPWHPMADDIPSFPKGPTGAGGGA